MCGIAQKRRQKAAGGVVAQDENRKKTPFVTARIYLFVVNYGRFSFESEKCLEAERQQRLGIAEAQDILRMKLAWRTCGV